jgi:F0F1-type ATP synthase alpha subunit
MDDIAVKNVAQFEKDMLNYFTTTAKPVADELTQKKALDADLEKKLTSAITSFKSSWKPAK